MRMPTPIAWFEDTWVPQQEAVLHLDDLGLLQGASVVDRMRTCNGELLDLDEHVHRFVSGCRQLGIEIGSAQAVAELITQCAAKNATVYPGTDFSIVTLATPGRTSGMGRPTLIVHTAPIPWARLRQFYTQGQPLVISETENVPASCWSPQIKTRSRLHYFMADAAARQQGPDNTSALLLDSSGNLTDTSIANVLIVKDRALFSPPLDSILNGISLRHTLRLARKLEIPIFEEPISSERAHNADEILLCGSTGLLWPAASLNGAAFDSPTERPVYRLLARAYIDSLGFDFIAQALAVD